MRQAERAESLKTLDRNDTRSSKSEVAAVTVRIPENLLQSLATGLLIGAGFESLIW
jgi:hypothetical protein